MLLNAKRQTVWQWIKEGRGVSTCPDCGKNLVARQCELKISHFAHHPRSPEERASCEHVETEWHLGWKFAFWELPEWEIEVPLEVEGQVFRADAYHAPTRRVREFVHSLSPYYEAKHQSLVKADYDVFWLIDGEEFRSARLEEFQCKNGVAGIRHLLKPKALDLVRCLGSRVKVHYKEAVWQPGNDLRYWFQADGPNIRQLLKLWEKHSTKAT